MSQMEEVKDQQSCGKILLVLLGTENENKCMIGNTILQEKFFNIGQKPYARIDKQLNLDDQNSDQIFCIVNTPDNFIKDPEAYSKAEVTPSYPGLCVFLLVLQGKTVSEEEMEMFNQLKLRLREKLVENSLVVAVKSNEESSGEICERPGKNFIKVLEECGNRICVHNKNQDKNTELIREITKLRDKIHKQVYESNISASAVEEHTYMDIDETKLMKQEVESKDNNHRITEDNMQKITSADENITVLLLGKNDSDKCLILNCILENQKFQSENHTCEMFTGQIGGQSVRIIKTPDLFLSETYSMEGLRPLFQESCVILLVLQGKRVSQEEITMFTQLKERFGKKMVENTIVLVKCEKKLSSNSMDKHRVTFKNNLHKQLLDECGNRVCRYNKDITGAELVNDLMKYTMEMKNQAFKSGTEGIYDNIVPEKTFAVTKPAPNKTVVQEQQPADVSVKKNPITIVLLGQTGSGKSATGNTILGKPCFESRVSSVPVTQECRTEEGTVCGEKVRVIDTPDFFNEDLKNQEEQKQKCKELTQHGFVVHLLVMEIGRFTDGEREALTNLKRVFGEDMTSHTLILFTGKEKLKNKHLGDYINGSDLELQQLIKTCNSRCLAFNNTKKSSHDVQQLMEIIRTMRSDCSVPVMDSHHNIKEKTPLNKLKEARCRIS